MSVVLLQYEIHLVQELLHKKLDALQAKRSPRKPCVDGAAGLASSV